MNRPKERGRLILRAVPKRGYCGTCDDAPAGRVRADAAWQRITATKGRLG